MTYIVNLNTGNEVQAQFSKLDRDYYPYPVYEWIAEFGKDLAPTELDVIAWCSDIQQMSFKDYINAFVDTEGMSGVLNYSAIGDHIDPRHTVIYLDYDEKEIYFLD